MDLDKLKMDEYIFYMRKFKLKFQLSLKLNLYWTFIDASGHFVLGVNKILTEVVTFVEYFLCRHIYRDLKKVPLISP